jgi:predicted esterase
MASRAADDPKLEPNAILRFNFPNLPDTLATMNTGEKQPAELTARLPENYSRDGKFPLCVYLDGGDGGRGDRQGIARAIVGSTNFICVNLPLFKRAYNTNDGLISLDDFDTVSAAYHAMLQKLLDTVPNITVEHSAFGGFSNGAHTTGLLVAGQDEFILRHFQAFYLVEGGFGFLATNVLQKPSLKHYRFLVLRGDQLDDDQPRSKVAREDITLLARALELQAAQHSLDFTSIVMHGYAHEFPPKYMAIAGQWIRGEKLPSTEKQSSVWKKNKRLTRRWSQRRLPLEFMDGLSYTTIIELAEPFAGRQGSALAR